ncbi:MAG TPA: matrixin family metalloprotease [Gemmatimonadaceae bacterium]|jgi:hypothetical protein|nr:matrixin family metalloprotease [Gemmatimonadaceae bacterium]
MRRHLPSLGRALTVIAAAAAAAGIVDCAAYAKVGDGTLGGNLAPSVARNHVTLSEVLNASNGTYIGRLLADRDSTIERWPDHVSNPLRVWIDSSHALIGAQSIFPAAVREAFTEWTTTGIPLRFTYVDRPSDADIRVRWTDHLDRKTGSTTWRTDRGGWLTGSDITLATHISDGHVLDSRGMRAIALHEVGHALGLSHSYDGHDVMAALVRVDDLSPADRNTIKVLYSFNAGPITH